ncbi:HEXXH motif-containing putative peptide modification protein [Paenibacillus cellulositrophicus]|nr:HEXXH motif-containing putative peptide modification protein [Paenibacillus cellulositrophicus]
MAKRAMMWALRNKPELTKIAWTNLLSACYSPEFSFAILNEDYLHKFFNNVVHRWQPESLRVIQPDSPPVYWHYISEEARKDAASLFKIPYETIEFEIASIDYKPLLIESINVLKNNCPDSYNTLFSYVRDIIPFESNIIASFSGPKLLGAIFINVKLNNSLQGLVESIVHETGHVLLDVYLATGNELVSDTDKLYISPWRNDLRPSIKIFHGIFAFWNVIRVFRKLKWPHEEFKIRVIKGCETLLSTNELTIQGKEIIELITSDVKGDVIKWNFDLPIM